MKFIQVTVEGNEAYIRADVIVSVHKLLDSEKKEFVAKGNTLIRAMYSPDDEIRGWVVQESVSTVMERING